MQLFSLYCIVLYSGTYFQFFQKKCRHGSVGPPVFSWPGGGTCGYEEHIGCYVLSSPCLVPVCSSLSQVKSVPELAM